MDTMLGKTMGNSSNEGTTFAPPSAPGPSGLVTAEDDEEGSKKKKVRARTIFGSMLLMLICGLIKSLTGKKEPRRRAICVRYVWKDRFTGVA
jgi:hypothetical protein